jgi:hypothetical protein
MNVEDKPPWSKGPLKRLGEALKARSATPADGPGYDDVMLWHTQLAAAVEQIITTTHRNVFDIAGSVSGRAKILDTSVDKLIRQPNPLPQLGGPASIGALSPCLASRERAHPAARPPYL